MAGFLRDLPALYGDDVPVQSKNSSIGSFNNTGRGTQNISGLKNTGYKSGDGNGAFNRNHFGNVYSNNGYHNSGTQNIDGLINNCGYTNGNGNGSIVFGGFDSSTTRRA